ncbi:MAG: restriction endonuclease subunit S [Cyanobacteriota bacterium]|jgi:type I restriction enzyme S subunit
MTDNLKRYPLMKATNLPWVDQVPSHWELVPNRALLRKRKVLVGDRHADYRLLSLTKSGVIVRDISTGRGKFSADMGTSQEVREGDLVFCLFDVPETPRTVGLSRHHGMITGAYTVFECKDTHLARFLEAFYIAMDDRKLLSPLYSGLRNTIPPPVLLGQKTPLPPAPEQAAIVRFLDHADRKIRRYIHAKQKLIKLLEEQKQAIINRAVTRGLDPNVPLKPTGVEWMGEVPDHWEVVRSRRLFTARKDFALPGDVQLSATQAYGVIPQEEYERQVGRRVVKISMHLEKRKHVERGDFVMSMRSFQGGLERAWSTGAIRSSYVVFKPSNAVDTDFYTYLFKSRGYIGALQATADFIRDGQDLTEANFRGVDLPLPPRPEQALIASYIAKSTKRSVYEASRLEREINLLLEYRNRLIADVVTGKLDVREAAAQLPDEDQELPPIDESDEISGAEEDGFDDLDEGTEEPEP